MVVEVEGIGRVEVVIETMLLQQVCATTCIKLLICSLCICYTIVYVYMHFYTNTSTQIRLNFPLFSPYIIEPKAPLGPPPELGIIYRDVEIKSVHNFGVFVEVLPGYEGLVSYA